jgi:hypothetical protein
VHIRTYVYICIECFKINIMCIYHVRIRVKTPFSGPQKQQFNYAMQSITLHKKSFIYTHFRERASFHITAVCFVDDIMRHQLSKMQPQVPIRSRITMSIEDAGRLQIEGFCYRPFRFKPWTGSAIQFQSLNKPY